jgi:hypothetical protein
MMMITTIAGHSGLSAAGPGPGLGLLHPDHSGGKTFASRSWTWECCKVRHLHWKDFLTNPARTWDEVWWVAKREYLTKEEAKAQRLDVQALTFEEQKDDGGDKTAIVPGEKR